MKSRTILRDSFAEEATREAFRDGRSEMNEARFGSGRSWYLLCLGLCLAWVVALQGTALSADNYNPKNSKSGSNDEETNGECEKVDWEPSSSDSCSASSGDLDCNTDYKSECKGTRKKCVVCGDSTGKQCKWKPNDPPGSVPSLGESVQLGAISGGSGFGRHWGEHIGFGPNRDLNYLAKLHLTSDLRFARIYDPESSTTFAFEREGTSWIYLLVQNENAYLPDDKVEFFNFNGEGIPQIGKLLYADGREWTFGFETSETNSGGVPGITYRIVSRRTNQGHETTIAYNTSNVTVTDASGHAYVCSFDVDKRITLISVNGRSWSYAYSPDGLTLTETDDQTSSYIEETLDSEDRAVSVIEDGGPAGGRNETYRYYDAEGDLYRIVENGIETLITRTTDGDTSTITRTKGGLSTTKTYVNGVLQTSENGLGETSTYSYNSRGIIEDETDPLGHTVHNLDDSAGRLIRTEDKHGVWTEYDYIPGTHMVQTKRTVDGEWSFEYDSYNNVTRRTYPDGGEKQYVRYPQESEPGVPHPWRGLVKYELTKRDATTWTAVYFEYNDMGQVTLRQSPWYCDPADPADSQPGELDPEYAETTYAYDSWGNRTGVTDENGIATGYGYDLANRLTSVTSPDSGTTTYLYDGLGRKIKQTDAVGAYTEWHYDSRGFIDQADRRRRRLHRVALRLARLHRRDLRERRRRRRVFVLRPGRGRGREARLVRLQ